jgi:hypothetical protein
MWHSESCDEERGGERRNEADPLGDVTVKYRLDVRRYERYMQPGSGVGSGSELTFLLVHSLT